MTFSGAILGVDGLSVEVEVDLARGIPSFSIVGLPNAAVRESRERVTAAIKNTGLKFPLERITVNLAPADIKKEGSAYDLAIAMGVIAADARKQQDDPVTASALGDVLFLGELALNGAVRPVRGVLPILLHAKSRGFRRAVVPAGNFAESQVVEGVEVFGARHLIDAIAILKRLGEPISFEIPDGNDPILHKVADVVQVIEQVDGVDGDGDFADVIGQESAKRAMVVAACGGHHVLMVGPPGAGKTMLAKRFATILPVLGESAALETTMIYSIAGLLGGHGFVSRSPFRSPHHSASDAGMIGGGNPPRPGEITLAHNGVLFLDELPEFRRHVLETLREPLEGGSIVISRARQAVTFPARFQLVAAMNPCPCGQLGNVEAICRCAPLHVERYHNKISGPLLDRIAIHVFVRPVKSEAFNNGEGNGLSSQSVREQVERGHAFQAERFRRDFGDAPVVANARLSEKLIRRYCSLDEEAGMLLVQAQKRLRISARGRSHILRVARTIADLAESRRITTAHVGEAIQYRMRDLPS